MTKRTPDPGRAVGFTLVELLVALFVTAIIFAMGYGAINEALANREVVKAQQERLMAVQTAVRVLSQDFTQVAPRPVRESIGEGYQPAIIAQDDDAERLVVFTRAGWANPAGVQRPALQRVAYEFKDNTLTRLHWPVLDTTQTDEVVRRDLLKQVKSVKFRFMDSGRQWYDRWPAQRTTGNDQMAFRQRPVAVEVTLELEDWGEVVRIIEVPV